MKHKKLLSFLLALLIFCYPISTYATSIADLNKQLSSKYMILVNRDHKVSAQYVPDGLVNFQGSGYKLEKKCADALSQMINACPGEKLVLYSGYRSYQSQYNKYYGKIEQYIAKGYSAKRAKELTDQYYAPPGASEHHTGLAADISTPSIVNRYGQLHESFGKTSQGQWLRNNSWKYGFILRYDEGKEKITGYSYEPWHFRYVGKEHAKEIYDSKLTYEEYIQKLKDIQSHLSHAPSFQYKSGAVTFSAPNNTKILYTNDGNAPTSSSPTYTHALTGKNITYKAITYYKGYTSDVTTVTITKYGHVFRDITVNDWFYESVSEVVNMKAFQGIGNYQFAPSGSMNRAMMVQVLANISGVDLRNYKNQSSYMDVNKSAWYAPAVQWATEHAVVQGLGNQMFAPEHPITREQVCVILHNYTKKDNEQPNLPFVDAKKISHWAKNGVSYCVSKGIIQGYPNGSFQPQKCASRAEVAKIILCYLNT